MADSGRLFRTALSGFHKGDVTAYIEKTALQHRSQLLEYEKKITDLQEENRSLQQQLNLLMMATPVTVPAPAPVAEPTPVHVAEPTPVHVAEPAPAPVVPAEATDWTSLELQAYRRAEAVERHANIRVKKLYENMEDLCSGALGDFQAANEAAKQAIAVMMTQTDSLEKAYRALSAALDASREKMSSLPDEID